MIVIIAGSRNIRNYTLVEEAVKASGFEVEFVVSGGAGGVDRLGEQWAREHGVPVRVMQARWDELGKKAGYVRNSDMAKVARGLVAVWDGKSNGTRHMIDTATKMGLNVYVHMVTME